MQLCLGAREMAELCRRTEKHALAQECDAVYQSMKDKLNSVAWDGEWYVRTICEDGYHIGSNKAQYGKIFLNPQSWAVLSGVAEGDRAKSIMGKVDEHLEDDIGYRICQPPYAEYDARVGNMSNTLLEELKTAGATPRRWVQSGSRLHAGRSEQAWRTFQKVTPEIRTIRLLNLAPNPLAT